MVRREKTRNQRNQPKKVWGGGGENERGWNKTHTKSPQPYGTEEARRTSWHEILGPALQPASGFQMVTPPTFLVSRVRGHMWVLGGLLDMEVHVVQLHVQADRGG